MSRGPDDLDQIDPAFVADLEASKRAVRFAADWLSHLGFPVIIRPTFVRPSFEERHEYGDNGDLEIVQKVEVKHRNLHFTCQQDFPYRTVLVDTSHAFDRARPKPYAYLVFNKNLTHCCVVYAHTKEQWLKTMKDSRGRVREHYECPKELCRFFAIAKEVVRGV